MEDDVTKILDLLKELWNLKKDQFLGLQPIETERGKTEMMEIDNKFANFFSGEFIDTSVGGDLSRLDEYYDAEGNAILQNLSKGVPYNDALENILRSEGDA